MGVPAYFRGIARGGSGSDGDGRTDRQSSEHRLRAGRKGTAGDLLVQQDISSEKAQLRAAEATVALAKIKLERSRKLLTEKTVSQSKYDNADAQYKQAAAQVDNIRAAISKKTIRAPFAGRLGIRLVNLGQILNEGEPIVSLQTIDPIFVNFFLPQQQLAQVQPGLTVRVTTDALPAGRSRAKSRRSILQSMPPHEISGSRQR